MDNEWISVEERLPEHGEWYLVAAPSPLGDRVTTMAFLDATEGGEPPVWLAHNDTGSDEWDDITHWMPLPAPPHTAPRA
ncbi:MAG: hypothetical protein Unbinned4052contig1001_41 [Prokaryotic dsDNA virus sp.]|nr:MAG: hypothetical protein Unbinned4052contig1001_41 [Prokaryotic dsDNA virus sp.]|tara:strand:- start:7610 stop:7846 length:237 start_codon:yes stop_codon:yes gene_type:complete